MRTARNHVSLVLLGFALLAGSAVAPGTTRAQTTPVLGSTAFAKPDGEGWVVGPAGTGLQRRRSKRSRDRNPVDELGRGHGHRLWPRQHLQAARRLLPPSCC